MTETREDRIRRRKIRRARALTAFFVVVIIGAAIFYCLTGEYFNVDNFKINGNSYYSADEVLTLGNAKKGGNIFIGTKYKEIKERLLRDTYIKKVVFEKELPSTVIINITERKQLGIIDYGSYYLIIDEEGTYLRKTDIMPEITTIRGFTLNDLTLGSQIGVEEEVQFKSALRVLKAMNDYDMFFYAIEPCEGDIKAYVLENLICQGTAENIESVLETNALQGAVAKLLSEGIERGTLKITNNSTSDGIIFSPIIENSSKDVESDFEETNDEIEDAEKKEDN